MSALWWWVAAVMDNDSKPLLNIFHWVIHHNFLSTLHNILTDAKVKLQNVCYVLWNKNIYNSNADTTLHCFNYFLGDALEYNIAKL